MKRTSTLLFVVAFLFSSFVYAHQADNPNEEIDTILQELKEELTTVFVHYSNLKQAVYTDIGTIKTALSKEIDLEKKVNLLIQKEALKDKIAFLETSEKANINKIRYLKGLSIIKILYEKVLALDHHFSSIATFNEINKISNPNNYQEFAQVKSLLNKKRPKKNSFNLTGLLGQNMYTSAIDMVVNLFISEASTEEKNTELQKIECIMDFTLRMNNDLNTIYFETAFLQKSNDKVMLDLEQLFKT